jgi:hypothetical protein
MEQFLDKLLEPTVVWVVIPVLAILFWGLTSVIEALRGKSGESAEWQAEMQKLRDRVEALEKAQAQATVRD